MSAGAGNKGARVLRFLLLSSLIALGGTRQLHAEDLLAEGISLFEAHRYDLAQEKLTSFLNAHPGNPIAMFYLARIEPEGPKSQEYLQRVVDESPQHALADDALAEIADYYFARGYYITAQNYYQRVLQDYPRGDQVDRAQFRIGRTYLAVKKPSQARDAFKRLLAKHPAPDWAIQANAALVDVYLMEEDWENSISLAEDLVGKEPYLPVKAYLLKDIAEGYEHLGRKADADVALRRILVECPNSYEASRLPAGIRAPQAVAVPTDTSGHFAVQVGAFGDSTNAADLRETFAAQGFSVFLDATSVDSLLLWRVRIGPYRTRAEAELTASLIHLPDASPPGVVQIEK
jgi:tetratricopeptide (TPR) repeat protein